MNNAQLLEITQMQANDYTPSGSVDGKKNYLINVEKYLK